jgi:hypothetical protein
VAGNHLVAAHDHHLMHLALDQHLAVPVLGGHGVVVRAISHQRGRADARGEPETGLTLLGGRVGGQNFVYVAPRIVAEGVRSE